MLDASHGFHVPILPTGTFNIFYERFDLAVLSLNLFFHAGCLVFDFFLKVFREKGIERGILEKVYFDSTSKFVWKFCWHKNYPLWGGWWRLANKCSGGQGKVFLLIMKMLCYVRSLWKYCLPTAFMRNEEPFFIEHVPAQGSSALNTGQAKEWFFLWSFLWEVRDCCVTRHIRTNGRETLQHSQSFCWKSDHVEEEEKEFSNLNEGEERKAETGQDEGKTETQKNRMKGRSDAKTGDNKGQGDWRTPFPQP